MLRRLNWGCGPITPFGWINSDIQSAPGVHAVGDILQGLPFPDEDFDYIVSIHALPEIPYRKLDVVLRELYRLLKPGGYLRLGLPDMDRAIQAYLRGDVDYFLIRDEDIRSLAGKMIIQLTWYGQSRCQFTADFMQELLERNQYREVRVCGFQKTSSPYPGIIELDDRQLESFFIEGRR